MVLVKENKEKRRAVFKLDDGNYKKFWYDKDIDWLYSHIKILNRVVPGYVVDHGSEPNSVWLTSRQLPGFPANLREHTDEFMMFIYDGCVKHLQETAPYSHGDWVLSNIYVEGNRLHFCDWDNIGMHGNEASMDKMHKDLYSAFGPRFFEIIDYDPAGF